MDNPTANLGGVTISASLADAQNQINQALGYGTTFSTDTISQFASSYRSSGGGPILKLIGFNPFQIFTSGNFHLLYWSIITLFLSITCILALHRSISARTTAAIKHPLGHITNVYFRLLVGVLVIANTPIIYGFLMTINLTLSQGVQSIAADYTNGLIQSNNLGTLTFAETRAEAIRNACARRVVALYPSDITKLQMIEVGNFYNAVAQSINNIYANQSSYTSIPVLDLNTSINQSNDAQTINYIGRFVMQNFPILISALGSIDPNINNLEIIYPSNTTNNLPLLSSALVADDLSANNAIISTNSSSSTEAFENSRQNYSKAILNDTLQYLDTSFLTIIRSSPTLTQKLTTWFSERVEQAAIAANNFMSKWRILIDWAARDIGIILTRLVSFVFSIGVAMLIEIELFVLTLAVPFWLLPSTEDAFYGILRSLSNLSIIVPVYQFIMLFVDGLMGLALKYILLGSAATATNAITSSVTGAVYSGSIAIATISSDGELIILVAACYLIAYLFLTIYIAIKTPSLIGSFIKGAGVAGEFISNFATGVIAGASTALVTAGVSSAPTSLANRLLYGSNNAGSKTYKSTTRAHINKTYSQDSARSSRNTSLSDEPDASIDRTGNKTSKHNYKTVAVFGLKTFVENLSSNSALESFTNSMKAADSFRKQNSKNNVTKKTSTNKS